MRSCRHCGTEIRTRGARLYCSLRCKGLAERVQVDAICAICGGPFTHISSRCNKAKYCSRVCYYRSMIGRGRTHYTCRHCGKAFFGSASHKRVYCSRACNAKERLATWRPSFITVRKQLVRRGRLLRCDQCGFDEEPRILGVHHKDENKRNNELINLAVLCPNCHSREHLKHIPQGYRPQAS